MTPNELSVLGLTPNKQKQLQGKGISDLTSLLNFFPRKYDDFTQPIPLSREAGSPVVGAFIITARRLSDSGFSESKTPFVRLSATDAFTGQLVSVVWFHQRISYSTFQNILPGRQYFVAGKADYNEQYRNYTIASPSVFRPYTQNCCSLYPVYSRVPGMSVDFLRDTITSALALSYEDMETLPQDVLGKYNLPGKMEAYRAIHQPLSHEQLRAAQRRFVFDDLLSFSLQLQSSQSQMSSGSQYNLRSLDLVNHAKASLPYQLTSDQENVLQQAFRDMKRGKRVNALIQGDVGSGKTIVAFLLMLAMVGSGFQCALMAPSKVLAHQHYTSLKPLADALGIKIEKCISITSMKKSEQTNLSAGIASGVTQIVVGTHSLLSDKIQFKNLALVVTDEEHRFGVAQRAALVEKASAGVHCVTMSATPIPMTLARVVYGDTVSLYTINTMPNGRIPVKTFVTCNIKSALATAWHQLQQGHQIFVVCPSIAQGASSDRASVEETFNLYDKYFTPMGYVIYTLTGKDSQKEMERKIHDFENNTAQILIATTVIEVGVNIPNATMIIVHDADMFGLSTLHQLRGRVGRSCYPSGCVLISEQPSNPRLQIMTQSTNGFDIAKADLEMRGPGDWLGSEQSGFTKPVGLMLAWPDVYKLAKQEAAQMLGLAD